MDPRDLLARTTARLWLDRRPRSTAGPGTGTTDEERRRLWAWVADRAGTS